MNKTTAEIACFPSPSLHSHRVEQRFRNEGNRFVIGEHVPYPIARQDHEGAIGAHAANFGSITRWGTCGGLCFMPLLHSVCCITNCFTFPDDPL